jgi:hypothetical protein
MRAFEYMAVSCSVYREDELQRMCRVAFQQFYEERIARGAQQVARPGT